MSIRVMSVVWDRYPAGGSKLLTMLALADWADDEGERIYPSMETLAAKCRMSERQIRRIVGELVNEDYLILQQKSVGGTGKTNRYKVNLQTLSKCPSLRNKVREMSANPDTGDRKPGHSYVTQSVISVNNRYPEQSDKPVDNSAVSWGPPGESKIVTLTAYVRHLEKIAEEKRPPGELERARAELDQLRLQAGEA